MKRLAVVLLVAACGSKPPPPAPAPAPVGGPLANKAPAQPAPVAEKVPTDEAEFDAKATVMLHDLAALFRDSADCPALASAIRRYTGEHKAVLRAMKEHDAHETPEQKKAFEENHKDDIADMMKAMEPVMKKCAGDKDVQASMKDMLD